jgi:hypothetical protein
MREGGIYEKGDWREEIWCGDLFQAVIFFSSVGVELPICGFGWESPWWFVS